MCVWFDIFAIKSTFKKNIFGAIFYSKKNTFEIKFYYYFHINN